MNNEDDSVGHVVEIGQVHETSIALPITVKKRAYFSSYHLWAAAHFAALVRRIEDEHDGRQSRFDIRHRAYVTNTIFSCIAFLEAAINELFQDVFDGHESYVDTVNAEGKQRLAQFWRDTEEQRIWKRLLQKYQTALELLTESKLAKGEQPYQDAALVVSLRNVLVHYKPKTLGGYDQHDLVTKLKEKFPENGLIRETMDPWFPDKCLGYGCAKWAHTSVKEFADEFFERIGVLPNYQRVQFEPPPDEHNRQEENEVS